jgi:hypothetical protein
VRLILDLSAVQLDLMGEAVFAKQGQFGTGPTFRLAMLHMAEKVVSLCLGDKPSERVIQQALPWLSEQGGRGQIKLLDDPLPGQTDIADRRKIVEIGIAVARVLQRLLGFPQVLILHLQLHLVHLEFQEKALSLVHFEGISLRCL